MPSRMFAKILPIVLALLVALGIAWTGDAQALPGQSSDPVLLPDLEDRLMSVSYQLPDEVIEEQLEIVSSGDSRLSAQASNSIEDIVASMSLDEKIAQMLIPAIRSWDGTSVTTLPEGLAEALRRHQYGGIILFGANMASTEQTALLTAALQANNAQTQASTNIPYLMCADGEGGLVVRLATGTRMTGSMAVGATGSKAVANAQDTGRILGEELAAVGVNVDFAPDVDVNSNPANPVIGTRSFSDDPSLVADLGAAFAQGLAQSGVVGSYKHFPGHGDTGTDSHTGLSSVDKTYEQLMASDLVPFKAAIDDGADLIMTAHIVLPNYDDPVTLGDGSTGNYPATMSPKIITELLRGELGYDGVIVTDALEMGAIIDGKLVEGYDESTGSGNTLEYATNVAERIIEAGVDLLLIPTDLTGSDKADFYDAYINELAARVRAGEIDEARIDESVTRILALKQAHGILDMDPTATADLETAKATVGSAEHRATEMAIAREAMTLVKNDSLTLPFSGHGTKTVIAGRDGSDPATIVYALKQLRDQGLLSEDARIVNLYDGSSSGSADSDTSVAVGCYYDTSTGGLNITAGLLEAIADADNVVVMTKNYGIASMQPGNAQYQGASQLITAAHEAGARVVLLSDNLPYDVARYQDADAILLAYMAAGLGDPTDATGNLKAYNANVVAAIQAFFDNLPPTGTLPVNVPALVESESGVAYSDSLLYERGFGLRYRYCFTAGEGASFDKAKPADLAFANNARHDLMTRVLVDGAELDAKNYTGAAGSTELTLASDYLSTLKTGSHTLTTEHAYPGDTGTVRVQTAFEVTDSTEPTSDDKKDDSSNTTPQEKSKPSLDDSKKGALAKMGDMGNNAALFALVALVMIGSGLALRKVRR